MSRAAATIAEIDTFVAECQAELAKHRVTREPPWGDLETLFCGAEWFGVTTATPLQRAICRCIDGKPIAELWEDPAVRRAFVVCPTEKPFEFALLAGVRGGKSLLAGACAVHWAWVTDVSICGPGEVPRLPIVSVHKDLAQVIFGHIAGRVQASEGLRGLLMEPPTGERILLRHPTGRPIEIVVSAGARAGVTLVARWLIGCIFDEFPRMVGGSEAVVNWADSRAAVMQRILPGGGLVNIGSPWAPFGPAFDMFTEHFGKPTKDLVVVRAPAYDLNNVYYTPEKLEEARRNPDTYQTDILAEFASPAAAMFPDSLLKRATREDLEQEPEEDLSYVAAIDPATRSNGFTLVIATQVRGTITVVLSREWRGSRKEPLDPEEVLQEISLILKAYRIRLLHSDQWSSDALKALARRYDVRLVEHTSAGRETYERYQRILDELLTGNLSLPNDPMLLADLRRVKKVVTRLGLGIDLPSTSDGRHADLAPAISLAIAQISATKRPIADPATPEEATQRAAATEKISVLMAREAQQDVPIWKRNARKPLTHRRGSELDTILNSVRGRSGMLRK